jgi:hypothetical protein
MASKDDVAQLIVAEATARGHTREECLAEMSALYQESGWDENIWDPSHTTYGVAQQDGSYPHRFEGAAAQIKAFFDKLDAKRTSPNHGDIWLNICWLQQAPNWPSAQYWYDNGRRAYLDEIKSRIETVTPYLDKYWPVSQQEVTPVSNTLQPNPKWRGDPVFLLDVLRAFGVDVYEVEGARDRGHGDFGKIDWVLWHHTGSVNETDNGIAFHPELGLAANMLIHPDGKVAITGTGIAWHGGVGIYPGIPEDGINQVSIGIECAYGPDFSARWPDVQIITMVAVGAAISWFLGMPVNHQIAHKEWAGADNPLGINKQGKPDPANLDMDWFRGEIAKRLAQGPTGVKEIQPNMPLPPAPAPQPEEEISVPYPDPELEVLIQTRGRFAMLGDSTPVEALSDLLFKAGLITKDQHRKQGVVLD